MPGFGIGMGMVLRPQLRLEQRLQLVLIEALGLPEEGEAGEQRLALEKMKEDLESNVYYSAAEFSERASTKHHREGIQQLREKYAA